MKIEELELGELTIVETTSAMNGYPEHIKKAVTGFEDFEQAQEFARDNDLELVWLDKRDGWKLWHRGNTAFEPLHITEESYGDTYTLEDAESKWSVKESLIERVKEAIDDDNYDMLTKIVADHIELLEAIDNLAPGLACLTECGLYIDDIETEAIEWYFDTKHIILGAIEL